jgi:hypothetical protein
MRIIGGRDDRFRRVDTFFEFSDHFVMVEANRQDAALQGILEAVNSHWFPANA